MQIYQLDIKIFSTKRYQILKKKLSNSFFSKLVNHSQCHYVDRIISRSEQLRTVLNQRFMNIGRFCYLKNNSTYNNFLIFLILLSFIFNIFVNWLLIFTWVLAWKFGARITTIIFNLGLSDQTIYFISWNFFVKPVWINYWKPLIL